MILPWGVFLPRSGRDSSEAGLSRSCPFQVLGTWSHLLPLSAATANAHEFAENTLEFFDGCFGNRSRGKLLIIKENLPNAGSELA